MRLAFMIFGGGLAQTTLAPALRIGSVTPDVPLVLAVLLGLAVLFYAITIVRTGGG